MKNRSIIEKLTELEIEWRWLRLAAARRALKRLEEQGTSFSSERACKKAAYISRHASKLMEFYNRM